MNKNSNESGMVNRYNVVSLCIKFEKLMEFDKIVINQSSIQAVCFSDIKINWFDYLIGKEKQGQVLKHGITIMFSVSRLEVLEQSITIICIILKFQ